MARNPEAGERVRGITGPFPVWTGTVVNGRGPTVSTGRGRRGTIAVAEMSARRYRARIGEA